MKREILLNLLVTSQKVSSVRFPRCGLELFYKYSTTAQGEGDGDEDVDEDIDLSALDGEDDASDAEMVRLAGVYVSYNCSNSSRQTACRFDTNQPCQLLSWRCFG